MVSFFGYIGKCSIGKKQCQIKNEKIQKNSEDRRDCQNSRSEILDGLQKRQDRDFWQSRLNAHLSRSMALSLRLSLQLTKRFEISADPVPVSACDLNDIFSTFPDFPVQNFSLRMPDPGTGTLANPDPSAGHGTGFPIVSKNSPDAGLLLNSSTSSACPLALIT